MSMIRYSLLILISISIFNTSYAKEKLPDGLVNYQAIAQSDLITGSFEAKGSTRISPIIQNLIESFQEHYNKLDFNIEASGSGTAIEALIIKEANLGLMSRKIKPAESNRFIDTKGYHPTEIRIAMDALQLLVNRHNPLNTLSLEEIEAIFSADRKCGAKYSIDSWEEFGWTAKKEGLSDIERHIFKPTAGARDFFQKIVLCGGAYKENSNESATTPKDSVENIASSLTAIGFASIGIEDYRVKRLAISKLRFHPVYYPTFENIINTDYPLSRYLYIYIDKPPTSKMPPLYREFFKFLFSKQGQQIILNHKAIPLPPNLIKNELMYVIGE